MEPFFESLAAAGVRALIGKGEISGGARDVLRRFGVRYFATIGGAGAFLAKRILSAKVVRFPELGAEAIFQLGVENFPAVSS